MDIYKFNFTILEKEIFNLLSLRSGEQFSQREMSKLLKVSPTAVSYSVKNLEKTGLIRIKEVKTINFVFFNRDNPKAIELKRVQNLKNIYISKLLDYLRKELPGGIIILFGSYSLGEDVLGSDIDLVVLGRKDKLLKLEIFEKNLCRNININFYNSWKEINKHLKNNILNGIILEGSIEL